MKKIISVFLTLALLLSVVACAKADPVSAYESASEKSKEMSPIPTSEIESESPDTEYEEEIIPDFTRLGDPKLLQYVEDTVYCGLVDQFSSEDCIIENVKAVYYSKEYLEEMEYNSRSNIFFGYTLAELDQQFGGERYVFTLGGDGSTVVEPFEDYDNTYEKVIKNVAIGTGVIMVCVTVSVISGGAGAAPISAVFAASAKTGALMATSSGLFSGIISGIVKGVETKDFDEALKAAALSGSESFKWGAIFGSITGGISELSAMHRMAQAVDGATEYAKGAVDIADDLPQWRQAELRALNQKGGFEQLSFMNGDMVPYSTPGATRPDVVRMVGDHLEAVEVKYYNLASSSSRSTLLSELEREVTDRVVNLPGGSTQRVVLDVTNRDFSRDLINSVKDRIVERLMDIYPNIPIDVVGF